MGISNWVFSVISAATLFVSCSFALTLDGFALLELKSGLNDTRNSLENWRDSDESPCSWTGVSCNTQDQRVVSINLPYMQLGGIISPSIEKLSRLQRLLHGTIPNEITNCYELRAMYLRANYLQGGIPPDIGNLSFLTILDLSSNTLKGAIPSSLSRLTRLRSLNMSTNFFTGVIPDIGVLSRFGAESFTGNLDLCGRQPWDYGQAPQDESSNGSWWQQKNPRSTDFGYETTAARVIGNQNETNTMEPAALQRQRSWVPPQPPPVVMPEAAEAIRRPKPLAKIDQEAAPSDDQAGVSDELQKITKFSESGGDGSENLKITEIHEETEQQQIS